MEKPGASTIAVMRHYEAVLGECADMHVYGSESFASPLRILMYTGVAQHGNLLLTAGLSEYAEQIGSRIEVGVLVDQYADEIGDFMVRALRFAITEKLPIAEGFSLQGLSAVNVNLANAIGKEALYFSALRVASKGLAEVSNTQPPIRVIGGVLISASENEYFLDHGAAALEEKLTDAVLASSCVKRPPVV